MIDNATTANWAGPLLPADALIGNPDAWWWCIAAVIAACLVSWSVFARRRAQRRFATADRLGDFFDRRTFFSRHGVLAALASAALVCLSLVLLTLGLMDVRWGKSEQEVPQKGIEMVFLLDVSRSMLAADVAPNRLERAKQMIRDMTGQMTGDRVGLVVFAGENRQTIPLTNHYEDFSQMLEEAGPTSVRRGGSKLGDAIAAGGRAFLSKTSAHRVLMILTDGEDQESEPVKMAKRLHEEEGIRVFTIGLGDMASGARIPEVDPQRPRHESGRFVKYQGQPVWSKMNGEILREVAAVTDAAYIPAGTKQVDMAAVYKRYIAGIEATEFGTAKVDSYVARYQWFALPALVLLLIEFASKLSWGQGMRWSGSSKAIGSALLAIVIAGQTATVSAQSTSLTPLQAYHQGIERYRQEDLAGAVEHFSQAIGASNNELAAAARYNLATALYAQAVRGLGGANAESPIAEPLAPNPESSEAILLQAVSSFRSALRLRPDWDDARANLEKTVRLLTQIKQQRKQEDQQQQEQTGEEQESENSESQSQQSESSESESKSESQPSEQDKSSESESESAPTGEDKQGEPDDSSAAESMPDPSSESPSKESPSNPNNSQQPQPESTEQDDSSTDEAAESETEQPPQPDDASGKLSSGSEDEKSAEQPSENGGAISEAAAENQTITPEEAQKMLQAVRDRDMIRRYRLQQLQRSRQIQVDRDW